MIHLTYTGPLAGQRLCADATPNGADVYNVHAMYCPNLDAPEVCAVCRAIWYTDDSVDAAGQPHAAAMAPRAGAWWNDATPPIIACTCGAVADATILQDADGRTVYVCRNPQHGA